MLLSHDRDPYQCSYLYQSQDGMSANTASLIQQVGYGDAAVLEAYCLKETFPWAIAAAKEGAEKTDAMLEGKHQPWLRQEPGLGSERHHQGADQLKSNPCR